MTANRGRLGAYALWQLRDYASGPMIWTMLAVAVFGVFPLVVMKIHAADLPEMGSGGMYRQAFEGFVAVFGFLAPMLAVARIVSKDRSPGLTRFVFAKPVGVRQYYAQAWIVRTSAAILIAALTGALINQFIGDVPWGRGLEVVGICWVLVGGVGLLLSVLTKMDTGLLIAVYLIPDVLSQLISVRPAWSWWAKPVLTIMPPMHRLDEIRHAILTEAPFPQNDVIHALLYGAGCAAVAILLVRKLPLVR
jgi:ABC-type transport system involved in multi-copper enzyme maturation permease subunit